MIQILQEAHEACVVCDSNAHHLGLGTFNGHKVLQVGTVHHFENETDFTPVIRCNVPYTPSVYDACSVYTILLVREYKYIVIVGEAALKQLGFDGMSDFEILKTENKTFLFLIHMDSTRLSTAREAIRSMTNET